MVFGMQTGAGTASSQGGPLARAGSWWVSELAGMMPARPRRESQLPRKMLLLCPRDGRLEFVLQRGAGERTLGGVDWDGRAGLPEETRDQASAVVGRGGTRADAGIRIDAAGALIRDMTFPAVVEDDLRDLLTNRIDRITPYTAEQVAFGYDITGRDAAARTIGVRLTVVPRARFEPAAEAARALDLDPVALIVAGDGGAALTIDLRPPSAVPRRRGSGRGLTVALVAANVVLAAVVFGLPLLDKMERRDALAERMATARLTADVTNGLRDRIDRLGEAASFLPRQSQEATFAIDVLEELTAVVPDRTWVERMSFEDGELQVLGQSPQAPSLIGAIEGAELFSDVKFRAPVTQGTAFGLDRFHISAGVAEASDGE